VTDELEHRRQQLVRIPRRLRVRVADTITLTIDSGSDRRTGESIDDL